MKKEKVQEMIGLSLGLLVFGIVFIFTGCGIGDLINVYDPITMEPKKWTPYNMYIMNSDSSRENKIRLLNAFYKVFPGSKRLRITNEDVLKKTDAYCSAKQSGYSKAQMDKLIEKQIELILSHPELDTVAEEVSLRLKTIYALSDEYICPHDSLSGSFNDTQAVELYLTDVNQRGFDESVINEEGKADLDRTILLAGRTACEEIKQYGYQKALEQKLKAFSSDENINVIYTSAYKYLCHKTNK
ncbi:hypothetical protein [Anabaena sp. CCY 0017]|uniref:hypothetical protein n=1 Tax=Anabaena sp. CCY 0017 TaxID=3103866 RepID=UPI00139AE162|nr:MAG: hypothetical protein EA343_09425 [Nodularia sp. (in: cyanobacteria)]